MSHNELPDDINAQITREYQQMFDEFVYARKLDIENDNWPPQDEDDWKNLYAEFQNRWSWATTWL